MSKDDAVAPDGSPVAVYLRVPTGVVPELVHGAIAPEAHILELGCGTGRITHPLVGLGHEVVAVDNSSAMLRHVRGARTVLADVETLALDEQFDVVLLASHLIDTPDATQRQRFLDVCARHCRPGGVVLIERYEVDWARTAIDSSRQVGDVTITLHDLVRDNGVLHASVTYEVDGDHFTQRFSAAFGDDTRFFAEADAAGLTFDRWLDPARTWARLTR